MSQHCTRGAGHLPPDPASPTEADTPAETDDSPLRRRAGSLRRQLDSSRQDLSLFRAQLEHLRERLVKFESEHYRVCNDYASLEEHIAELERRAVVMEALHGTLDHGEVLTAIQDTVIYLIGSEELVVYELSEDGLRFVPVQSFGVGGRRLGPVAQGVGPIGRAATEQKLWTVLEGAPPEEEPELTACAPIVVAGRSIGVIAIWRMLGHKPAFVQADRELLEFLARQAGTALYLTAGDGPAAGRAAVLQEAACAAAGGNS